MNKYFLLIIIVFSLPVTYANSEVLSKIISSDIYEPPGTYEITDPYLLNIYAETIIDTGSCIVKEYTGCTLRNVLNDIDRTDDFKPEVKIIFNTGEYLGDKNNATLRQRGGQTSRLAPLKSFRIKLNKKEPLWRNQRRIQLIKSFNDISRIRNKLSFDFFAEIPHLPSLYTQFINLSINDNEITHRLGLYTHIEHVGKEYLNRRNWNENSSLYKAEYFFFSNSSDFALNQDGKPISKSNFESHLEIKAGKNHKPLINMLKALEDKRLDFQTEIFETYFDKNNFLTWLSINILFNNIDTKIHNYYLYNPHESKKFYFIPWDYDRAWGHIQEHDESVVNKLPNWWFSHSNWWENQLIKRFLSTPGNLNLLQKTIEEIKRKYLTSERIQTKVNSYRDVIFPVIRDKADWETIKLKGETDPEKIAEYNRIMHLFSSNVEFNYNKFLKHLKDPMPFRLKIPSINTDNHEVVFSWDKSISLFGQKISYDLEISDNPEFKDESIIERVNKISGAKYSLKWRHPKGTYYYRIISRDVNAPSKYWQLAWNRTIKLKNGLQAYGVRSFIIDMDEIPSNQKGGSILWSLLFLLISVVARLISKRNTIAHISHRCS